MKLDSKAQKSHIIPENSVIIYQDLFDEIERAELPSGDRPFDPKDYLDNGQALPSRNTDQAGKAIFDLSQHRGSHPVINELIEEHLQSIRAEMRTDLARATTTEAHNIARVAADAKTKNVADAFAAIAIGAAVDPNDVSQRAIYNLVDANAKSVIPNFDALSDTAKRDAIKAYNRGLIAKLISDGTALSDGTVLNTAGELIPPGRPIPNGQLTAGGGKILKVLRDLVPGGGSVGALSSADVKVGQIVLADMIRRGIDPLKANAAGHLTQHAAELVPAGTELAERAGRLTAGHALKFGGKVLAGLAPIFALHDYADALGTVAAIAMGDAHFSPGIDDASFAGGVNYLADWATKAPQQGLLGGIPLSQDFVVSIANLTGDSRRLAIENWINSRYKLPDGLAFHISMPTVSEPNGIYSVDDTSTSGIIEHIEVLWRNPIDGGSDSPRAAAMVLERVGSIVIVTDLATGKARALPAGSAAHTKFIEAVTATNPAVKQQKLAELMAADPRSVEVQRRPDGRPDPTSVANAAEVISRYVVNGELVELLPEIVVTGKNEAYRTVSVVVDGAVHVVRGLVSEIEQLLVAIANGPGVVLDDIRKFRASKQGLISFEDVGTILGSQLSQALAISNPWQRIGAATAIGSILSNIGQSLDLIGSTAADGAKLGMTQAIDKAFHNFGDDVLQAGTGAVSSYLVGNLLAEIGLAGDSLDAAVAFAGPTIGKIAFNALTEASWNSGLTTGFYATAASSFLGSKLADRIITFDSLSGQIGAAVGEAAGTIIAVKLFEGSLATGNPYAIVAAAVVVAVSKILGGLIGSLFGPSTSSATITWDGEQQAFLVGRPTSKRGGSKDAAQNLGASVAESLNAVIQASGARVIGTLADQSFGMRNKEYVYWTAPTGYGLGSRSRNYQDILKFGIKVGLDRVVNQLGGGDVFIKRALLNSLATQSVQTLDMAGLFGDFAIARDYNTYLSNRGSLHNLLVEQSDTTFAAGWIATLARAHELGIDRRAVTDWIGGWSLFLDEMNDGAVDNFTWNAAAVRLEFNKATKERLFGFTDADGAIDAYIADTIDSGSKNEIVGTDGADMIYVAGDQLGVGTARVRQPDGVLGNIASPFKILVAATIDAGAGDDVVVAGDLGNEVFGGAGNDRLVGGNLDDWLFGGEGNDLLTAGLVLGIGGFTDAIGIAFNLATAELDIAALISVDGGNGNLLDGGAGDDLLLGGRGSDWLEGGEGVDRLEGGAGDDVLVGGGGDNDSMRGGSGGDQYVVRRGDGVDLVEEDAAGTPPASGAGDAITQRMAAIERWKLSPAMTGALRPDWAGMSNGLSAGTIAGGEDSLVFGEGIVIADIRLRRSGAGWAPGPDLVVTVMDIMDGVEIESGTSVTLKDWFTDPFKRIEWLKFADGTEIRISDIASFVVGGAGDDVLIGTAGNDFVYGGAGNDRLYLLAGDDIGNGGTGDDLVSGDAGRDLVVGGLGADQLIGGAGADAIGGDGGADDLYGGADGDILSGGRGDGDVVVGGAGDDRFKYSRGDGRDTIFDEFVAGSWSPVWVNNGWAAGYVYDSTTGEVRAADGTLVRKNVGTLAVPDFQWVGRFDYDPVSGTLRRFAAPASGSMVANSGVDTLEFAPDINIQDVILRQVGSDLVLAIANDGMDTADTAAVSDSVTIREWYVAGLTGQIEKLAFYQTGVLDIGPTARILIAGTDGADGSATNLLAGTALNDWITGAAGDDWIAGGHGDDIIAGNSGSDTLRGEAGADVLYGGTGNDTLDGGAGGDVLIGGSGFDIASYASATAAVRVQLSAPSANAGDAAGDEYSGIEGILGGSASDFLGGDDGQNELAGGGGADALYGGAGDDTYVWNGSDGSDTIFDAPFVVEEAVTAAGALGDGYSVLSWESTGIAAPGGTYWRLQLQDSSGAVIYDYDKFVKTGFAPAAPTPASFVQNGWKTGFARTSGQQVTGQRFDLASSGGDDVLEIGAGLSLGNLGFVWSGNDLIVAGTSGNQVTLQSQALANSRIETLQLADGLAMSLASVLTASSGAQLTGTTAADLLVGQAGALADDLAGGDGDDVLVGYAGNDLLDGGAGDDLLEGGTGADTLVGGANSAIGSSQSAGDTVRYAGSTAGVAVDLGSAAAQAGGDAAGDLLSGIENAIGSKFNDSLTGDSAGNRLAGLDGDDILLGKGGDDVLLGELGNDLLYGDAGIDALSGGDGNDNLWGGADNDQLDGGHGDDTLYGEAGDDLLSAGSGDDVLHGGAGADALIGDIGNDTLTGGDGNDTLSGGAGNDALAGGLGNDDYLFDAVSGADRIVDASGVNTINFGGDVRFDQLWMVRSGNDLKLSVIGGGASVILVDFFVTSGSRARVVQTATHAFYLDNSDSLRLVTMMTGAASAGTVPGAIPATIASQLETFWHAGGKAAPTGPATPIQITLAEDQGIAFLPNDYVVDHDGGTLSFAVKAGVGQQLGAVILAPTAGWYQYTPQRNVSGADSFTLIATDADGQSVELQFALTITPVNDAPTVSNSHSFSVFEAGSGSTTGVGTIVGTVIASDLEGNALSFLLPFDTTLAIDSAGVLTVKDTAFLDYELGPMYSVLVAVSDGISQTWVAFPINIKNVNEANAIPTSYQFNIVEGGSAGALIGSITATDPDSPAHPFGTQRYFFHNGDSIAQTSADGRFVIDSVTGAIKALVAPDFETQAATATYQVVARDNAGNGPYNEVGTQITISLANVNERNSLPATYALAVAEGAIIGTVVGTIAATDPDSPNDPLGRQRYYFLDAGIPSGTSADGYYAINPLSGIITTAAPINFESGANSRSYVVVARDNAGDAGFSQAQSLVTIAIGDVNEANSLPDTYAGMTVAENVATGTIIGSIVASDLDGSAADFGQQRYYFLDGIVASGTSSDGRYAIDAVSGVVKTNAALSFETSNPGIAYIVVARDNGGASPFNQAQTSVTIEITDVNEANSIPAAYAFNFAENSASGTAVGMVTATDGDGASATFGQQRYYFLNGSIVSAISADGRYSIDVVSGVIRSHSDADYEAGTPLAIYAIVARDNAGEGNYHQVATTATIGVENVNEANTLPSVYAMSVAEDAAAGIAVGTVTATDSDATGLFAEQRYYFLNGTAASATSADGRYVIDAITGVIKINAALNFEADDRSATYQVIARDNAGIAPYSQAKSDVTIGITDGNEAPTAIHWLPTAIGVVERDRVAPGIALDAVALAVFATADPDTAGSPFATYSYSVSDARFEFVGNSLRLKQGAALDYEAGTSLAVTVTATDATSTPHSISASVTIDIQNQDDILQGGGGDDMLSGQQNCDVIAGFAGNDLIDGGAGDDSLDGGAGDDRLLGGLGADALVGGDDSDVLVGGDGNDTLNGGNNSAFSHDRLFGGAGNDSLYGDAGDDLLVGGNGADRLDGGSGIDWADYSLADEGVAANAAVTVDLTTQSNNLGAAAGDVLVSIENVRGTDYGDTLRGDAAGNLFEGGVGDDVLVGNGGRDTLLGGAGQDNLSGGDGADLLQGEEGNDVIYGGAGNDLLYGGAGDDHLYAEAGNDMLDGGTGNDFLQGGADHDTYLMSRSSGADTIDNYDGVGTDVDVLGLQDSAGEIQYQDLWFERSGEDMLVTIIGTDASARILNWYTTPTNNGASYKIDFITTDGRYTKTINAEGLVGLMATRPKPKTVALRDALMGDAAYKVQWANYWDVNQKPVLAAITDQTINEDSPITITVTATDDITPSTGIAVTGEIVSGGTVVPLSGLAFGIPDSNGARTLTITPAANLSGIATIRLWATDAGAVKSDPVQFTVTVDPVADMPTIASFAGGAGNSGPVGVPLTVNVNFPDKDGSELQELWIGRLPAGVTLSAGTYDSATAMWKLTTAQTEGLRVTTPVGWSKDLALTLTARATENGQTVTASATATVALNAPPTDLRLGGNGIAPPALAEYAPGSSTAGVAIGVVAPVDPDWLDRNRIPADFAAMPRRGTGEERIVSATGPLGGTVSVLETGQFSGASDQPGGGVFDVGAGPIDPTKVYKYTIYVKAENNSPHALYWGTRGNVENAETGTADPNPYFWYRQASTLVQDRWYRVEGYVLPTGSALVAQGLFGGVYDAITGQKVDNTNTFRFAPGAADTGSRFFSFYGESTAGYSGQWYQPVIEQQDFSFALTDNAGGRFAIDPVTGLITAVGSAFDYESATSHDVTVRVTDGSGAQLSQTKTIAVTPVNEAPLVPSGPARAFVDETGLGADSATVGAVVATYTLSDPDGLPAPTLEFTSNPGTWFSIVGNTVRFATGFDFETMRAAGYSVSDFNGDGKAEAYVADVRVRATDGALASPDALLQVFIQNVNEAPVVVSGAGEQYMDETGLGSRPANAGTVVADFSISDPDRTTPYLALTSNPNNWFFLDGTSIKINGGLNFDFETLKGQGYAIADRNGDGREEALVAVPVAVASDGQVNSAGASVTVYIQDVNERPNNPVLEAANVFVESTGADSHAWQLQARFALSDPDGPAPGLVILGGNDYGWFQVNGGHIQVTTANWTADWLRATLGQYGQDAGFYYDTNGNGMAEVRIATLTVAARDAGGLQSDPFTYNVYIENKNEAPNTPGGPWRSWFGETGLGGNPANAGTITASYELSDPDGPAPSLEFVFNPNNWFYIEGRNVRFNAGLNFDFEWARAAGYSIGDWNGDGQVEAYMGDVVVRATDGGLVSGATTTQVFIQNVNEAPVISDGGGAQYLDETGLGARPANAGQLVAAYQPSDPDGPVPSLQFVSNPNNWFYIDGGTVRINAGLNLDFEWARAAGYQIADRNGDGRLEAYLGDVVVRATDGALVSGAASTPIYIQDVNERPNAPVLEVQNIFQETIGGESHASHLQARFGLSDPDGTVPGLEILAGNDNGWFQVNGSHIQVTGANWSADWLRANRGGYGTDAGFYYDINGNGLLEIRVATLTVATRDAAGAQSDPFAYNIFIEDRNEAPYVFGMGFDLAENAGWYAHVGAIAGGDIDGDASSLRYGFTATGLYWDSNLGRYVSGSGDGRFVMDQGGNVYVNGWQELDFDHGINFFSYGTSVTDRGGGAYALSATSVATIQLFNIDEQHELSAKTVNWSENVASTPYWGVSLASMVFDPDGTNAGVTYTFDDNSLTQGAFSIDRYSGALSFNGMDYEALTTITDYIPHWDEERGEEIWVPYTYCDPSLATFNLGITAHGASGVGDRTATLTLNITNNDEAPKAWTAPLDGYDGASSENQIYQDGTGVFRIYRRTRARFAKVLGVDPEGQAVSYQIIGNAFSPTAVYGSYGSDSTIVASAAPQIYMEAGGYLSMYVPGDPKSEWRGGYNGQKMTVVYNFTVRTTDAGGNWVDTPISITMYQRNIDVDPIAIDLDDDGIELIGFDRSSAMFDMDDDGFRDQTGWIGADDALLALDRDGNGRIEGRSEISFRDAGLGELTELEGLQRLDSNENGFFDSADEAFSSFLLWRDVNQNGISEESELRSLKDAGIEAISLTRDIVEEERDDGNTVLSRTVVFRADGSTTTAEDVNFLFEPSKLDDDPLAAPIILDLDGDGKTVVALADSNTRFDMAGNGQLHKTAWADAGDAFLVRDRNGNAVIDDIDEISFVADKAGAKTDLEGLAAFDGNGDGVLDANDAGFAGFGAWIDGNSNGRTDAGELQSLAEAGIISIALTGTPTGQTAAQRTAGQSVIFNTANITFANGSTTSLSDVGLAYDPAGQLAPWFDEPRFRLGADMARAARENGDSKGLSDRGIVEMRVDDIVTRPSIPKAASKPAPPVASLARQRVPNATAGRGFVGDRRSRNRAARSLAMPFTEVFTESSAAAIERSFPDTLEGQLAQMRQAMSSFVSGSASTDAFSTPAAAPTDFLLALAA